MLLYVLSELFQYNTWVKYVKTLLFEKVALGLWVKQLQSEWQVDYISLASR